MTRGRNVPGEPLECCCMEPLTGFTRSGWCETGSADTGRHVICAVVTRAFLDFSLHRGNAATGIRVSGAAAR